MTTSKTDYYKPGKWQAPDIMPRMNGERFYLDQHGKKIVVDEEEYQQSLKDKGLA